MKVRTYAAIFIFFLLMMLVSITIWNLYDPVIDLSCSSYIHQESKGNDYLMTSNTLFNFSTNGKGFISMDGAVTHQNKEYKFRRDYRFQYKNVEGNKWRLFDIEVTLAGSDDVPTGLVERNFYTTQKNENGNYVYIAHIKGNERLWIIGGLYTPAFICYNNAA